MIDAVPAGRVHDEPPRGWVMIQKRWHADDADSSADQTRIRKPDQEISTRPIAILSSIPSFIRGDPRWNPRHPRAMASSSCLPSPGRGSRAAASAPARPASRRSPRTSGTGSGPGPGTGGRRLVTGIARRRGQRDHPRIPVHPTTITSCHGGYGSPAPVQLGGRATAGRTPRGMTHTSRARITTPRSARRRPASPPASTSVARSRPGCSGARSRSG